MTPFRVAPKAAAALLAVTFIVAGVSVALLYKTVQIRYRRDINRMVFDRNRQRLSQVTKEAGLARDSLTRAVAAVSEPDSAAPYLVVSLADRRVWYKKDDSVFYSTKVAIGSGKTLVKRDGKDEYKFDTPRGRLVVLSKDAGPVWVPPDWHYLEIAKKRKLGVIMMRKNDTIRSPDGTLVLVDGRDVVKRYPDGHEVAYDSGEGREIIVGHDIVVPPFGTNQRKYRGTLGTHRLDLGDGYALHGTDDPRSIGKAVSHGCIRLRNEDIDYLYGVVPVGTPVYVY